MTNAVAVAQYGGLGATKNRIINGAMMISQRGASPTITGGGDCSVDRFYNYYSGVTWTSVQSTTAPEGFKNSLLLTVTSPSASPTYSFFGQCIEGYNIADLNWGTVNAKTITYSFWVRSSVVGVYSLAMTNSEGNRAYPITYTINSANTWQYVTVTVPGDTSGNWVTDNGMGLRVRMNLGSGAARLGSSGSWQAGNYDGATGSTGANTWANTSGATFYITGVQLEKGSTATSFDYRPYGTELALCQRYYTKFISLGASYAGIGVGVAESSTSSSIIVKYPVTMRAAPTAGQSSTCFYDGSAIRPVTSLSTNYQGNDALNINITASGGGLTVGRASTFATNGSTGYFELNAEL